MEKQPLVIKDMLKEMLKASENRLLNEIDKRLYEMKMEIAGVSERVAKLETVSGEIEVLKREIRELKMQSTQPSETINLQSEVLSLRNKFLQQENFAVACDLRIDGVPYTNNALFQIMCSNLNIAAPHTRAIYRIKRKNNKSSAPTIIVKLMTPFDKNFILRTVSIYRRNNKDLLRLFLLNFDANNSFYINESLSQTNYKIFNTAFKMKREKRLSSVFTIRGIVHVTINQTDQPIRIECLEQLNGLFRHDGIEQ